MARHRAAGNTIRRRDDGGPHGGAVNGLTLVLEDGRSRRRVAVRGPTVMLGRAPTNDVVVDDGTVSARHARIDIGRRGALIIDLASTNGTFVDGTRVDGSERLSDGCVVELGGVTLVVEVGRSGGPSSGRADADDGPAPVGPSPGKTDRPARADAPAGTDIATNPPRAPRRGRDRRTVLVAHDPADGDVADAVVEALRADGHLVWVDRSPEGEGWGGRLLDTVWSCDLVVFLVSAASATSERAGHEVHVAGAERTPVVPVLLADVDLPPDLAYYVEAVQPVDLRDNVAVGLRSLLLRVASTPRKRVARPWLLARRLAIATAVASLVVAAARFLS